MRCDEDHTQTFQVRSSKGRIGEFRPSLISLAIMAAVLLTFAPEGLRMIANASPHLAWIGESRMLFYSLILIVLMIARPQGLFTWPMWKRKSA